MIPVLLGVIIIVFTLMYLTPGDAAEILAGSNATPETVQALREKLGTDKSYLAQLGQYIKNLVLHGDLGKSYSTGRSVSDELLAKFPTTLKLTSMSMLLAVILGVTIGIISAVRQYSLFDSAAQTVALVGVSMPSFWLGLLLIIVFALKLKWLPSSGFDTVSECILPCCALAVSSSATIMRITRSSMLDVIRSDYIRTARAKGQNEFFVIVRHALKNALIPILTVVGMEFGVLLGGTVMIETIFSVPGIGSFTVNAIKERNTPVVQGTVLLLAVSYSLVNLIVDILYSAINPQIRMQYSAASAKKARKAKGKAVQQ